MVVVLFILGVVAEVQFASKETILLERNKGRPHSLEEYRFDNLLVEVQF